MLLGISDVDNIMEQFGFTHFPRAVGNPRQQFIHTSEEAFIQFSKWDGNSSCFISTGGYDNIQFEMGGKRAPKTIHHTLTFFDFDHNTKPENAFADAHRLSTFLMEMNVAHWVQYSGAKGYHLFILHQPTKFRFDYRDGSSDALKQLIHQTQNHLRLTLGLNTLDEQTMGDPKRLCRFPFTQHVNRLGKVSGRYAFPIDQETFQDIDHDEMVEKSYSPQVQLFPIKGRKLSLKDFIIELGIKLHSPETMLKPIVNAEFGFNDDSIHAARFISALSARCPGVVNELKRLNPPHKARVYAALNAKILGYTAGQFEKVWVQLGTDIGYVDLHNTEHRQYQMATIFDDPKYVSFPTCSTLKANGCCVGDICPKFKDMGEITTRIVERKWRPKNGSK